MRIWATFEHYSFRLACVALLAGCGSEHAKTSVADAADVVGQGTDAASTGGFDVGIGDGEILDAAGPDSLAQTTTQDGQDGQDADVNPVDVVELLRAHWCEPLATAYCAYQRDCTCYPDPERPPESCIADTTTACIAAFGPEGRLPDLLPSIERGYVMLDLPILDACVTRVGATLPTCAEIYAADITRWCAGAFVADAALGDLVDTNMDGGELYCSFGHGHAVRRDAGVVCEALPDTVGAPCFSVCADGLHCYWDGEQQTCIAARASGESCKITSDCEPGLTCSGQTCRASLAAIGAECGATADCVAGARCDSGTCVAQPGASFCLAEDACGNGAECVISLSNECVAPAGIGETCWNLTGCNADGACVFLGLDTYEGTCAARAQLGERCDGGVPCVDGLACSMRPWNPDLGSTCVVRGALGDECAVFMDDDCALDLQCVEGHCATLPGQGDACAYPNRCAAGLRCTVDAICDVPDQDSACSLGYANGFGDLDDCGDGFVCTSDRVCKPRLTSGSICQGRDCKSGLACLAGGDGALRCASPADLGHPCESQCSTGICALRPSSGFCAPRSCPMRDFFSPGLPGFWNLEGPR